MGSQSIHGSVRMAKGWWDCTDGVCNRVDATGWGRARTFLAGEEAWNLMGSHFSAFLPLAPILLSKNAD